MNISWPETYYKWDPLKKQSEGILSYKSKPDDSHPCDKCNIECARFCKIFMRVIEKTCDEELSHNTNI
jgi:hypothetical protein